MGRQEPPFAACRKTQLQRNLHFLARALNFAWLAEFTSNGSSRSFPTGIAAFGFGSARCFNAREPQKERDLRTLRGVEFVS